MPLNLRSAVLNRPALYPLLSLGLGALSSIAMAPANAWPVLFFTLSAFFILLAHTPTKKIAFFLGWMFGFGYFVLSLSWIGNALLVEGNEYAWAWPLAVAGLPFYLAFYTGFAALAAHTLSNLRKVSGYFSFSACLILGEFLRGHVFTGFPWNLFGYTWADFLPIVQSVSVVNIYGLTWLTILWATLPGFLFVCSCTRIQKASVAVSIIFVYVLCLGLGTLRLNNYVPEMIKDIRIKIVQPNIAQKDKWDRTKMAENFFSHVRLSYPSDNSDTDTYIVWPETAISHWYTQDKVAMNILTQALQSYNSKATLITGLLRYIPETSGYNNSLVTISADGAIDNVYDKHHLVPFGEFIPLQKWIPLEPVAQFTGFVKGDGPHTVTVGALKYSPLVCYEVIFPGAVTDSKGEMPDVLINVTNDAWYGDSAGPHQHLTNARFRAVEEGIPLIRSANTGFSALIDPMGKLVYKSDLFSQEARTVEIPSKVVALRKKIPFENAILVSLIIFIITLAYTRKV